MRFLLILLSLCMMAPGLSAQQLRGVVADQTTGELLEQVLVENKNSGQVTHTDAKGFFFIPAHRDDTVQISLTGYTPKTLLLHFFDPAILRHIALQPQAVAIDTIVVSGLSRYQLDSIENRKIFGKKLEERPPKFKMNMPDPLYGGTGSINAPLSSWLGGKKRKKLKAFQERFKAQEQQAFIDSKYTPELVRELTGLEGDSLVLFMNVHPMPPDFAGAATGLEVRMWIRFHYRQWMKKEEPGEGKK